MKLTRSLGLALAMSTGACSLTPALVLPTPPIAAEYPVERAGEAPPEWCAMFGDPRLQQLIALALDQNRDLRAAALNAEAARAQIRVRRAQSLPSVGSRPARAAYARIRASRGKPRSRPSTSSLPRPC